MGVNLDIQALFHTGGLILLCPPLKVAWPESQSPGLLPRSRGCHRAGEWCQELRGTEGAWGSWWGCPGLLVGLLESPAQAPFKSGASAKPQACVWICGRLRWEVADAGLPRWDQLLEQGCPSLGPEPSEGRCSDKTSAANALQVALEYKTFDSNPEAKLPGSLDFANTYL